MPSVDAAQPASVRRSILGATHLSSVRRFPLGDVTIGLSLAALLGLSFVDVWFPSPRLGCLVPFDPSCLGQSVCALDLFGWHWPCAQGFPLGSMWEGAGLLPAMALVAAIAFFVQRRVPRIELVRPLPSVIGIIVALIDVAVLLVAGVELALLLAASVVLFLAPWAARVERIPAAGEFAVWIGFAVVESGFLLISGAVGVSYLPAVPSTLPPYPLHATVAAPGRALWVALGVTLLVGIGGLIQHLGGHRSLPAALRDA